MYLQSVLQATLLVRMIKASALYEHEYLGNSGRPDMKQIRRVHVQVGSCPTLAEGYLAVALVRAASK